MNDEKDKLTKIQKKFTDEFLKDGFEYLVFPIFVKLDNLNQVDADKDDTENILKKINFSVIFNKPFVLISCLTPSVSHLQFTIKELLEIVDGISKKSPFQVGEERNIVYDLLRQYISKLEKNNGDTVRIGKLSPADVSRIYGLFQSFYSVNHRKDLSYLVNHIRSSASDYGEFRWFKFFHTEKQVFGYRIKSTIPGYRKDVIMSHGFSNTIQGFSDMSFKKSDDILGNSYINFGFGEVEGNTPALSEEIKKMLEEVSYESPKPLDLFLPDNLQSLSLTELRKNELKGIEVEPKSMERYFQILGKVVSKSDNIKLMNILFDLQYRKKEGEYSFFENKLAKNYKSPYLSWLKESLPMPIAQFFQQCIESSYRLILSQKDLEDNPARKLLDESNAIIRDRVERNLDKKDRLRITETEPLVQMAFCNRILAMFANTFGLKEFEAAQGLHSRFSELALRLAPDGAGDFFVQLGEIEKSGEFKSFLSIDHAGGYSSNSPW